MLHASGGLVSLGNWQTLIFILSVSKNCATIAEKNAGRDSQCHRSWYIDFS